MIKRIIVLICVITLTFTTEIQAAYKPTYNNEETITRISDVDGKWWNELIIESGYTSTIRHYMKKYCRLYGREPYLASW